MNIYFKDYSINKVGHPMMGEIKHAYWISRYFPRIVPDWLNVDLIKRKQ